MDSLADKYVGKYFGPNKITGIRLTDQKTPGGSMVFEVCYTRVENNQEYQYKRLVPEKALSLNVRDQSTDYTHIFSDRLNAILPELVAVLEEYNIDYSEIDLIVNGLKKNLDMRYSRATNLAFTGDDSLFIPGFNPMNDVSLLQVEGMIEKGTNAS